MTSSPGRGKSALSGERHARKLCGLTGNFPVKENNGSYTLTSITRNGQPLRDDDTITVTCLATSKQMESLLASKSGTSEDGDAWVKNTWRDHISGGSAALAEPENYMTLR